MIGIGTVLQVRARPDVTGVAIVTITATDPDEAFATASIRVEVATRGRTGFRDDFDGEELSTNWLFVQDARIRIEDDLLKLTNAVPGNAGSVVSRSLPPLSDLVVSSRLAFGTIENTSVSVLLFGADPEGDFISILNLFISPEQTLDGQKVNYYLLAAYFRADDEIARPIETLEFVGLSDAVPDSVGEFMELKITTDEGHIRAWIDDDQLVDVEHPEWLYPVPSVWLRVDSSDSLESGKVGWFDWVDVEGEFNVDPAAAASRSHLEAQKQMEKWMRPIDRIRLNGDRF